MKTTLLMAVLLLSSCSRETWRAPMATTNDTVPLLMPHLQAKKITITGPVTFTTIIGTGNNASATAIDNNKAGQRATSAAIGPGAVATATTKQGLSYWWLLVPVAGLLWWQRKRVAMLLV